MAGILPELEPRQYTYVGFAFACAGMLSAVISLLALYNVFSLGFIPWWAGVLASAAFLTLATIAFQRMGSKKVVL